MSDPKIAVFFHARLSGGPIQTDHAFEIFRQQCATIKETGLEEAADAFVISCSERDAERAMMPCPKASIAPHPSEYQSELPTLDLIRRWVPEHPDWCVLYLHIKCATRYDDLCHHWRGCMMRKLVRDWKHNHNLMILGYEATGCHWLTPEECGPLVRSPYFGGNMWWAKASFLATLPALPVTAVNREQFFLAESWIGMGPRRPHVMDHHHEWPSHACAHTT